MTHYLQYNPNSTIRVEERLTITADKIFLRHIPKANSVVIDGFAEVDSFMPQPHQFSCQYALDSMYRDANRVLNFNAAHNGQTVTVSYVAIGTVITADDMNAIKAHLENQTIHSTNYVLPTASANVKGGIKVGNNLYIDDDGTLHASAQEIRLGRGLYFDDDGALTTNPPVTEWAYHDSGYDVIPAIPLTYVNDTQFYQPNLNALNNNMFDTPAGVMEFWMRGDLFISSSFPDGNRFAFGYCSSNISAAVYNGSVSAFSSLTATQATIFLDGDFYNPPTLGNVKSVKLTKNASNHFLLHAVSGGYVEFTLNYGTIRKSGNINNGQPFDKLFVYSSSDRSLFSNFVVSNTQIPYEE